MTARATEHAADTDADPQNVRCRDCQHLRLVNPYYEPGKGNRSRPNAPNNPTDRSTWTLAAVRCEAGLPIGHFWEGTGGALDELHICILAGRETAKDC